MVLSAKIVFSLSFENGGRGREWVHLAFSSTLLLIPAGRVGVGSRLPDSLVVGLWAFQRAIIKKQPKAAARPLPKASGARLGLS